MKAKKTKQKQKTCEIRSITKNPDDYGEKYMKMKFKLSTSFLRWMSIQIMNNIKMLYY